MLLEKINSPEQLKQLTPGQLPQLAKEIRQFLVDNLFFTGGHLGANLGVVELTIALHYLFDSPRDKIIWDVGHQAYVHKILTGRADRFNTLRKYKGLCGFPKRAESEHDVWETGHSSTSLSAAMGMATARDMAGDDYKVIAVIGDGAMTGGMAYEALNHIGHEQKDIMVILNDNEMSIEPNVGAMYNYLGKLRTHKHYHKVKEEVETLLKRIPAIGGKVAKSVERLKDSIKYLLVSGVIFEELGFTYLGPVDGHHIDDVMSSLKQGAQIKGPVLIHVVTKKGKGYKPAEEAADNLHSVGATKVESGALQRAPKGPNYKNVFADTLIQLAERDPRIVAITPAMLGGSGLIKFVERFPDRCFDVGIAEQHATTLAAGIATQGQKPVLAIYSTFLQRGYDQVIHDIARQNLNVFLAIDRAGLVGADGETHQGVFDIAFLRCLPNMTVMMPKDENEFRHMIYTALQYDGGPIAVRYPRGEGMGVPMDEPLRTIPIGQSEMLHEGQDVTLLAFGPMVSLALKAAHALQKEGIHARVINARFAKPLDTDMLLQQANDDMPIVTIEEGVTAGGFGSAVLEFYAQHHIYHMAVQTMGVPDYFVEHGSVRELREEVGLTVENIAAKARKMALKRRRRA
ncbi:MAG: 1-deoxy-D-xylulose-5-phosphate synthase [Novibacillus thermophilus]